MEVCQSQSRWPRGLRLVSAATVGTIPAGEMDLCLL